MTASARVAIVGGGFTGLAAAYEVAKAGLAPVVLEAEPELGGLAGSFTVGNGTIEKFYHHWFTSDSHIIDLIAELGLGANVVSRPTRTGIYYANSVFRFSKPLDLLRFTPLSLVGRLRLGLMVLKARRIADWRALEGETAVDWIRERAGEEVLRVVWEPLLRGKFGSLAPEVGAVWFWNKLKLRGGSRGSGGAEELRYYRGGFSRLVDELSARIVALGGRIERGVRVRSFEQEGGRITQAISADGRRIAADRYLWTGPLEPFRQALEGVAPAAYLSSLQRVRYLANVCLVLELDRSLSDTYWMNVADPSFPFVGVIEHTNFEPASEYSGRHIIYLSKYLPETDPLFAMDVDEAAAFAIPHLQRMFPSFLPGWIVGKHLWKARWSQPVVERNYSSLIPAKQTPFPNLSLCTMCQIYPEDRGTNYAVREGRAVGRELAAASR